MPMAPQPYKGHTPRSAMTKQERGYGGEWERISKLKRKQCPVCEDCGREPSTQVHHKVPFHGVSDPNRTNWYNLMALCADCHKRRH